VKNAARRTRGDGENYVDKSCGQKQCVSENCTLRGLKAPNAENDGAEKDAQGSEKDGEARPDVLCFRLVRGVDFNQHPHRTKHAQSRKHDSREEAKLGPAKERSHNTRAMVVKRVFGTVHRSLLLDL
jgi:hypothetical protein